MAQYKTGRNTKEKIIEVSKSLFYEKGYNDTSFNEICAKAEVNSGLISYHFKGGKCEIAKKIYKELMIYFQGKTLELFPGESNEVKMVMSLGMHQKIFYKDPKYRKFSAEFSTEGLSALSFDDYTKTIPLVYDRMSKEIDDIRVQFYFAVIAGMDTKAETFIAQNIEHLPFEKTMFMLNELYLWYLDRTEREQIINKSLSLLESLDISNNEFNVSVTKK